VSKDLATCLLTGIVTDTLGFRTAGVTASTLNAAGRLMELGADLNLVTTQALLIKPLSTLRLWQIGLDKMKLEEDGLLWTAIGDAERQAIGYVATGSGGLVNMLANVDEAVMSAVLIEHGTEVHVGFRCRPPFNVAELALNLGGGGHPLASGCTLDGPLENAVSLVLSLSKETIQQQKELLYERG
jgi:phosphoesterase RecJ-like protein